MIQDIAGFTSLNQIALMDGHHKKDTTYGTYTVNINDIEIEFHDALLAPPSGVMSTNYSRYSH